MSSVLKYYLVNLIIIKHPWINTSLLESCEYNKRLYGGIPVVL